MYLAPVGGTGFNSCVDNGERDVKWIPAKRSWSRVAEVGLSTLPQLRQSGRGLFLAIVDDAGDLAAEVLAVNDHVDKAVLEHEFGGLKAVGQLDLLTRMTVGLHAFEFAADDVGVELGRGELSVSEQLLDLPDVGAPQQQMRGKRVAKAMGSDPLMNPRRFNGSVNRPTHRARVHMVSSHNPCTRIF